MKLLSRSLSRYSWKECLKSRIKALAGWVICLSVLPLTLFMPKVALGAVFTVLNTNDEGTGSLRQAILDSNNNTDADSIEFAIVGDGPHTISPLSALPDISDAVLINGYSQPGAQANTSPAGQ